MQHLNSVDKLMDFFFFFNNAKLSKPLEVYINDYQIKSNNNYTIELRQLLEVHNYLQEQIIKYNN